MKAFRGQFGVLERMSITQAALNGNAVSTRIFNIHTMSSAARVSETSTTAEYPVTSKALPTTGNTCERLGNL